MMRYSTFIFLLFITLIVSCSNNESAPNKEKKAEEAKAAFVLALASEKQGDYWASIENYTKANLIYDGIDSVELNQYQYLAERFKAKMLFKVNLPAPATEAMNKALGYLSKAPTVGATGSKSKRIETLTTKRFLASYLREAGEYQASSDILLDILKQPETLPGLHLQVKNLLGLNFQALGDHQNAFRLFNDILKPTNLAPELKAHYLDSWAVSAYHIGKKDEALSALNEAIGINVAIGDSLMEMKHRKHLAEIYMLDGKFSIANEQLNKALEAYSNVDQSPDLFNIYNLKYTTASVLGENASLYKIKFDRLTAENLAAKERFNAAQQAEILSAKMQSLQIDQERSYWVSSLKKTRTLAVVSLSLIFVLVLAFKAMYYNRKKRLSAKLI